MATHALKYDAFRRCGYRRPKALSLDLRVRVLAAVKADASHRETGKTVLRAKTLPTMAAISPKASLARSVSDGKYVTVVVTCATVRKLFEEAER